MNTLKKFLLCLCLYAPLVSHAEWTANSSGYLITPAQSTNDLLAVSICKQVLAFMAPTDQPNSDNAATLDILIRVDRGQTRKAHITVKIKDGVTITAVPLTPDLLNEIIAGQVLRVKWVENAYSSFSLQGFTAAAQTVQCEKEFFPDPESDADYFL